MILYKKVEKKVHHLWNYYLLFRCCILVIPIYIILVACGSYVMANRIQVPTILITTYELLLLVFSAAIIFIIVLILATFGSNSSKTSVTDMEYEADIFDSTNDTNFEDIITAEDSLLSGLERTTDRIQLLFDDYSDFVVDLVSVDHSFPEDSPPSYEEAVRSGPNFPIVK